MVRQSHNYRKSHHRRVKAGAKSQVSRAGRRHRAGETKLQGPFIPPEDWHEPQFDDRYLIIEQEAGDGYRHILTAEQVRARLEQLPGQLLEPLEVVQLSRMTKKKRTFPCYGMQWGCAIYLYPIEASLVEHYHRPPTPKEFNETRMFGGNWQQDGCHWRLVWTLEAIRDFYLNSVLIHELGHLLDQRNRAHVDRERYADWFAIEHGYKPSRRQAKPRRVSRRHHRG